ncbi:hypothetical protein ACQKWADRAFT_325046, partial [Trichoderma austrokoningii]
VRFGSPLLAVYWSLEEIAVFLKIFEQHQSEIYSLSKSTINWDLVSQLSSTRGVSKGEQRIRAMYRTLSEVPNSGFCSMRAPFWEIKWEQIHLFKQHLEDQQPVHPSKDESDLYFHIPGLEDGLGTSLKSASLSSVLDVGATSKQASRRRFFLETSRAFSSEGLG